jgi:HSP20 family protein
VTENKNPAEKESSKKAEITIAKKKPALMHKPQKSPYVLAPINPSDLYQAFDDTFQQFRKEFEDVIFPSYWDKAMSLLPETRVPVVDLEDNEKDYSLKAEMPGFKKGDIEIDVDNNSVVIRGTVGWKYDKKEHEYLCKERACKTFYRMVDLPEEIKPDEVAADLIEGILEIKLPKKTPKQKRKVKVA